jgi:hypothetical protein
VENVDRKSSDPPDHDPIRVTVWVSGGCATSLFSGSVVGQKSDYQKLLISAQEAAREEFRKFNESVNSLLEIVCPPS